MDGASANFVHASIRTGRRRGEVQTVLKQARHDPLELADAVVANLDEFDRDQWFALRIWTGMRLLLMHQLNAFSCVPSRGQMNSPIRLISAMLFFGKLRRVKFVWVPGLQRRTGAMGTSSRASANLRPRYWAVIEMDPADCDYELNVDDHFSSIVSVLLRECIRAFLLIYGCEAVCGSPGCRRAVGAAGHGGAGLTIMSHVEVFAKGVKDTEWHWQLHPHVNLGIDLALVDQWEDSRELPSKEEVALWHSKSDHRLALEMFVGDLNGWY